MGYSENGQAATSELPSQSDSTGGEMPSDPVASDSPNSEPSVTDPGNIGGGGGDVRPAPPIASGILKQVKAVRYKPLNIGDPRLNTNYSYYWAEVYPGRYAEFLSQGIVDQKLALAACERYRDQVQGHIAIDFMDGSSLSMDVSPSNRGILDQIVSVGGFAPGTIYFEPLTNDKLYLRIERMGFFSIGRIKDVVFKGRSLLENPVDAPNCSFYGQ